VRVVAGSGGQRYVVDYSHHSIAPSIGTREAIASGKYVSPSFGPSSPRCCYLAGRHDESQHLPNLGVGLDWAVTTPTAPGLNVRYPACSRRAAAAHFPPN
jgi:hypothetical protein